MKFYGKIIKEKQLKRYESKSYNSCAWHIASSCFIIVPRITEISLTVFKLCSGHEIVWKIIKGKLLQRYASKSYGSLA